MGSQQAFKPEVMHQRNEGMSVELDSGSSEELRRMIMMMFRHLYLSWLKSGNSISIGKLSSLIQMKHIQEESGVLRAPEKNCSI